MALEKVNIYRIVHRENVAYILEKGMFHINHPFFDPNNIFIGDTNLTEQRHEFPVPLAGYGNLGDYVPFYFGYRSPMLFNISTGYRSVTKRPQSDIIYIVCKLKCIDEKGLTYIFTDGHAKNYFTTFYTEASDLTNLDWENIDAMQWNNTPVDPDRMRRKQAECLVKSQVPPQCIAALVVYDEVTKEEMEALVKSLNLEISVHVNPHGKFYY